MKGKGHLLALLICLAALCGCSFGKLLSQPALQPKHGVITADEIWSGLVHVEKDVIISEGATLIIEPGTHVLFASKGMEESKRKLVIYGKILAEGTARKTITFESDDQKLRYIQAESRPSSWGGIVISSKDPATRNVLNHCLIDNAHIGINIKSCQAAVRECRIIRSEYASVECDGGDLELHKSELRNGGNGLRLASANVDIRGNTICGHQFGIAGPIARGLICDNFLSQNAGGIDIQVTSDGVRIEHNKFYQCSAGITLGVRQDITVPICDNEMKDVGQHNLVFRNSGNVSLKRNSFRGGHYGIYLDGDEQVTIYGSINDPSDPDTNTMLRMSYGNVYPYEYRLQRP